MALLSARFRLSSLSLDPSLNMLIFLIDFGGKQFCIQYTLTIEALPPHLVALRPFNFGQKNPFTYIICAFLEALPRSL
jgi:hypothetical protein